VRRISAPTSVSFEELMSTVYDLFGFDLPSFSLKYTDEDGDLITMKSELDLSEAMQVFQGRCLILHVMKNGQASTSSRRSCSSSLVLSRAHRRHQHLHSPES